MNSSCSQVFFLAMTLEAYHGHQLQYLNGLASTLSTLSARLSHLVRIYTERLRREEECYTGQFYQMVLNQFVSRIFGPGLSNIWIILHIQVYKIDFPLILPSRGCISGITLVDKTVKLWNVTLSVYVSM